MKNVLIVEDEMIIAMVLKKFIQQIGYNVFAIVKTGNEAINMVKDNELALILMDMKLKGDIDGFNTMQEIRKFSDIPIIYTTGNSEIQVKQKIEQTNNALFLIKPIDYDELKFSVEKIMAT